MSLRRKLMMILLLTAVVPMLAVRAVQAVSIYKLQARVATDMRLRLTTEAEQNMQRTVDGYARSLEQEASLIFALLQVQAAEVERRLSGPVPDVFPRVPTPREFEEWAQSAPEGIEIRESPRHMSYDRQGNASTMLVSYDTQVVLTPRSGRGRPPRPGVDREQDEQIQKQQLAQLASMTRAYQHVHAQAEDVILWQYTSLESGMHFSFPGKTGFPAGYSPRQRIWYRQAVNAGNPTTTRPFVDAITRQLIITFAQPVRDLDGQTLGVTAIDLPVSQMLNPAALKTDWADEARLIVVAGQPARIEDPNAEALDIAPDTGFEPDVYIVVDVNQQRRPRRREMRVETLAFDNAGQREAVTKDLIDGNNGVRRVSIDGQDTMVAYGRINPSAERPIYAMILAPTQTILAPSEKAIADVESELHDSLFTTGAILIALLVLVGIVAYVLSHRMTRPISELAHATRRVGGGSLDARVDIDRRDELGELARAFNAMVPALRDRMKIRESLAVAMQVQQSLLPNAPPRVAGLDIAGHSEYCDETGGDYYDFIELDQLGPDTLAIAVGDVTGHGIAAALLMATGRALIRSHANTNHPLGEVFTAVNKQLCDSEFTGRFMTLMYLIIQSPARCDQPDGHISVRYLSAGHDPVIVYRPDDDTFIELAGQDIPLGIDAAWRFNEEQSHALRPGDILVVGTDGIWECFNPADEQFGKDRLRETIRTAAAGDAESIAAAISSACKRWRGERDQDDDITLVVVKLLSNQS